MDSEYVLLVTSSGADLRLTPDHLLPLGPCSSINIPTNVSLQTRSAGQANIGMCLEVMKSTCSCDNSIMLILCIDMCVYLSIIRS